MLCLKKAYNDELFQLTLLLSLLRVFPSPYFETNPFINVDNYDLDNGTGWQLYSPTVTRFQYVHPKSLDMVLLNYEREVFADLNSLGRYNRIDNIRNSNITAYLLNVDCENADGEVNPIENHVLNEENENNAAAAHETNSTDSEISSTPVIDLTQEDMDLIEILWKQDVDLGYSLEIANDKSSKETEDVDVRKSESEQSTTSSSIPDDDIEKLKTLEALNNNSLKTEDNNSDPNALGDIWSGLSQGYTIDTETDNFRPSYSEHRKLFFSQDVLGEALLPVYASIFLHEKITLYCQKCAQ